MKGKLLIEKYSKFLTFYSVLNLCIFIFNTYFIKILPRDLFYFTGFYFPAFIVFALIIYLIYILISINKMPLFNIVVSIIINAITFYIYYNYMEQALKVN